MVPAPNLQVEVGNPTYAVGGGHQEWPPHLPDGFPGVEGPLKMLQSDSRVLAMLRTGTGVEWGWVCSGHGRKRQKTPEKSWMLVLLLGQQQLPTMGWASLWAATSCLGWAPHCIHLGDGGHARRRDPKKQQQCKGLTFAHTYSISSSKAGAVGKDLHRPVSGLAFFSHGVAEVPLEY